MNISLTRQLDDVLDLVIKKEGDAPIHHCLVSIYNERSAFRYEKALGFTDEGKSVHISDSFRTGSISKIFTATIILQLVEEAYFDLDDKLFSLLKREDQKFFQELLIVDNKNCTTAISIRNLLQHRSGLKDYFSDDPDFINKLKEEPRRSMNWRSNMQSYFASGLNKEGLWIPDQDFHYSDTNYLLLGVVIERTCGRPLHVEIRERILDVLAMNHSWLEYYEEGPLTGPDLFPNYGPFSMSKVNSSFDWAAGGLVSTLHDLELFTRTLLKGKLFKKEETLIKMCTFPEDRLYKKRKQGYGLGIQSRNIAGYNFLGHSSIYGGMLFYAPDPGISIALTLDQAAAPHKAEWLFKKVGSILLKQ